MFTGITQETLDTVGRFTLLWNVFERNFYNQRCGEPKIINGNDLNISNETMQKCNELKEYFLTNGGAASSIIGRLHFRNNDLRLIVFDWFDNNNFSSKAVVGVIYRIRCNAFHGNKTAFIIQGQVEMFECINEILICILQSNNLSLAD